MVSILSKNMRQIMGKSHVLFFLNQQLTASRWVNHGVGMGGACIWWLLPSAPVGVACCNGAVRNRETRWAASHRCSAPRHTHLWCTKPHRHGNKTQPQQTERTTTTTVSHNELVPHPHSVNSYSIHFSSQSHILQFSTSISESAAIYGYIIINVQCQYSTQRTKQMLKEQMGGICPI